MPEVTLFAGPSAYALPAAVLASIDIEVLPPARRDDIRRLVDGATKPGVMVLCDGVFQSVPAVSHAELCLALDRGWKLWGVSSIGAIRAHEMRHEGMRGFGYVHSQFSRHADFTDDELCLLHLPMPPFQPITHTLVDVRFALERTGRALGISRGSQAELISRLRELWFGDRTVERIREMLIDRGQAPGVADQLIAWLNRYRIKAIDLQELLTVQPWK
jgi:hypothetical protein